MLTLVIPLSEIWPRCSTSYSIKNNLIQWNLSELTSLWRMTVSLGLLGQVVDFEGYQLHRVLVNSIENVPPRTYIELKNVKGSGISTCRTRKVDPYSLQTIHRNFPTWKLGMNHAELTTSCAIRFYTQLTSVSSLLSKYQYRYKVMYLRVSFERENDGAWYW